MPKSRTLPPIRPSVGIQVEYERRVFALLDEMQPALERDIAAAWRANEPETVLYGADETPARALQTVVGRLGSRWLKRFDELSEDLAGYFATAVKDRCDRVLRDNLRRGGFSVRFRMTPAMRDAFDAVRGENVSLIKSIGQEHLAQVEQLVMRSVAAGRDLGYLTKELVERYHVTQRRAARIARHQNNSATSTMRRARELQLGLVEGEWLHSRGGKEPRPPHVAFSRKRFKLAEGHDFHDGEGKVLPGQLIGCKCTWATVVPGFGD